MVDLFFISRSRKYGRCILDQQRRLRRDFIVSKLPQRRLQTAVGLSLLGNKRHNKRKWPQIVAGED